MIRDAHDPAHVITGPAEAENHLPQMGEILAGAVLFDKDGVLLDTMAMIRSAWTDWAIKRGIDADEVMASIHMTAYELLARFAPAADPTTEIREIAAMQAVLEPSISAFPGAAELLGRCPRRHGRS